MLKTNLFKLNTSLFKSLFTGVKILILISFFNIIFTFSNAFAEPQCKKSAVSLQVLGSGGPELTDNRASSSYLIRINNQARLLIDLGSGSMQNFEKSGADLNHLDAILFSHLHVDHSADLPSLVKGSYFTRRKKDLHLYGPTENHLMPSLTDFIKKLFSTNGAYRYLSDYLDGNEDYRIYSHNISADSNSINKNVNNSDYKLSSISVDHGPIPAIAWRVDIGNVSIVFSGDMNGNNHTLEKLAKNADILVAHNAIPENAGRIARNLHMPPSVIGKIAKQAKVKQLILSHRMQRTLRREKESLKIIKKYYNGPVIFANDLDCFIVKHITKNNFKF